MKNKIKLKLYIYRDQNKSSYFFRLGNFGDDYYIKTCKVHSSDYQWFINMLKNDYGLIFPKNFKNNWNCDYDKEFNQTVIVYKDLTVETKEKITPYSSFA